VNRGRLGIRVVRVSAIELPVSYEPNDTPGIRAAGQVPDRDGRRRADLDALQQRITTVCPNP